MKSLDELLTELPPDRCEEIAQRTKQLMHEVHELKRCKSEEEAAAFVRGVKVGEQNILQQLRVLSLKISVTE